MITLLNSAFSSVAVGANVTTDPAVSWTCPNIGGTVGVFKTAADGSVFCETGGVCEAAATGNAPPSADYSVTGTFRFVTETGGFLLLARFQFVGGGWGAYALRWQAFSGWHLVTYGSGSTSPIDGTLLSGSIVSGNPDPSQTVTAKLTVAGTTITADLTATGGTSGQNAAQTGSWSASDSTFPLAGVAAFGSVLPASATTGIHLLSISASAASVARRVAVQRRQRGRSGGHRSVR